MHGRHIIDFTLGTYLSSTVHVKRFFRENAKRFASRFIEKEGEFFTSLERLSTGFYVFHAC